MFTLELKDDAVTIDNAARRIPEVIKTKFKRCTR